MIKLVLAVMVAVVVAVLGYYFYERAKELRLAEERAKAVPGQLIEARPPAVAAPPAQEQAGSQ